MKNIQTYLVNKDAPSGGFSVGKLKDDPGDSSGSSIRVATHNDYLYGFIAAITKYLGAVSDTDESDTASDVLDAHETMAGIKNPNVLEYSNVTAYIADDHVMYLGLQFVAMVATTGNNPIDNPDKWLPCFARDDAFIKWQKGDDIPGGFDPLHDYRDGAYRQVFDWGMYNIGGDPGGSGRNFEAFGVHLDGTQITGDATLVAIFDVGGGDEYHLLDIIAPDVVGTRTLLDARGAVGAVIDAGGGSRVIVGAAQADAAQRMTGSFQTELQTSNILPLIGTYIGVFVGSTILSKNYPVNVAAGTAQSQRTSFDNANSLLPNVAKTDDAETRMKNYSVGVPSILVINELP